MMMEAEKFPDVPSASWRPRRAVAHLSQKVCEPPEPVCEFQSESWQVRDPGGVDVSAQVQRPEKSCVWLSHQAGVLSQSALFALLTPAGEDNLLYSACYSDANLIQKPSQTTPRVIFGQVTGWLSVPVLLTIKLIIVSSPLVNVHPQACP